MIPPLTQWSTYHHLSGPLWGAHPFLSDLIFSQSLLTHVHSDSRPRLFLCPVVGMCPRQILVRPSSFPCVILKPSSLEGLPWLPQLKFHSYMRTHTRIYTHAYVHVHAHTDTSHSPFPASLFPLGPCHSPADCVAHLFVNLLSMSPARI